ncbi:FHA domain-containing protein [Actinomyces bowdenii]|uniref:FHA domain-containing protein n=1 Tax=Actinomyces bowdenii TaxID=131109 RepID=UPI001ABC368A|nr:FHA domain-containing protein [Actinomyces bowdenii]MBO3723472.1 FHA domain-containing protein [Actinomyces bowdenii]
MTGALGREARIVGGTGAGPPAPGGADEAGDGLPEGVTLTREGALRIEGLDGAVLLLEPVARARGPVGSAATEPGAPRPGAPQEGSPVGEAAVDPEALEVAARLLGALGGPRLFSTAPSTVGEEAAEPPPAPGADVLEADDSEAGGSATGAPGAPASQGAQDPEGPEGEDPQATGVWIDPDDPPVEEAPDAEGAEGTGGAEPSRRAADSAVAPERADPAWSRAPQAAAAPARERGQAPAQAGAAGGAEASGTPGPPAGPPASSGTPPPGPAIDLPVFSGFPEPEPGSGRRRRSPRSAASASAVAGAASAASGSLPLPGTATPPPARHEPSPGPPGEGGARSAETSSAAGTEAGPGAGSSGAAAWDEGEAGRSTAVIPAALAALGAAPIVLASLCPRGHANPPDLGQCVRCGHALLGDLRQVPRPVLVTLALSSGEQVPVAGDVVVGRAPQPPAGADAHLVALVSVPSATHLVSRSHLIFTTAEWNVFVQDLGSSNGTVLARPGHAAVLLPPYVPTPLLVGDLLDVGDGVTIHVEAPR